MYPRRGQVEVMRRAVSRQCQGDEKAELAPLGDGVAPGNLSLRAIANRAELKAEAAASGLAWPCSCLFAEQPRPGSGSLRSLELVAALLWPVVRVSSKD